MDQDYVRIKDEQLLSDNWYILKKMTFELKRRDGTWQEWAEDGSPTIHSRWAAGVKHGKLDA